MSLRTHCRVEAERRGREISLVADRLYETVMLDSTLTHDQIDDLARQWFQRTTENWERRVAALQQGETFNTDQRIPGVSDEFDSEVEAEIKHDRWFMGLAQKALAENDYLPVINIAQALIRDAGLQISPGSPEHARLCRALLRAQVEHLRLVSAWRTGDYTVSPADPLFKRTAPTQAAPKVEAPPKKSMPLAELVEIYSTAKIRDGKWQEKTEKDSKPKLHFFAEVMGGKPVDDVTRDDVRDWRDALTDMGLSGNTIGLHFKVVGAMFNWAKREGKCTIDNPTTRLAPKQEEADREAYTPEDLNTLFASPLYTGHWRADRREKPGAVLAKDHKFWLPLVSLHSGLRAEEAAKLGVKDVVAVEGVWCFSVEDTKTAAGKRIVPVHPRLIRLGLLDHHARVKREGSERLWPEIKEGSEGRYSQGFCQWWSRFRHLIGLTRSGLKFHSFRHTFISHMQKAGVPETLAAQIAGHAVEKGITYGVYGGKLLSPLERLKLIEGLDFGVDLSHLEHS